MESAASISSAERCQILNQSFEEMISVIDSYERLISALHRVEFEQEGAGSIPSGRSEDYSSSQAAVAPSVSVSPSLRQLRSLVSFAPHVYSAFITGLRGLNNSMAQPRQKEEDSEAATKDTAVAEKESTTIGSDSPLSVRIRFMPLFERALLRCVELHEIGDSQGLGLHKEFVQRVDQHGLTSPWYSDMFRYKPPKD